MSPGSPGLFTLERQGEGALTSASRAGRAVAALSADARRLLLGLGADRLVAGGRFWMAHEPLICSFKAQNDSLAAYTEEQSEE
jgi:hypothetical protein